MKKLAVHIGLNQIDNSAYKVDIPELLVCENDASELNNFTSTNDFESQLLLSNEATTSTIIKLIKSASKQLSNGDEFLLTYSGHGCQIPDLNNDETDGLYEGWICYDKPLIDDELMSLFLGFSSGVKIIVINDCCHSGGITDSKSKGHKAKCKRKRNTKKFLFPRNLPTNIMTEYCQNKRRYSAIKKKINTLKEKDAIKSIKAGIISLSACQEHEIAYESDSHGLFTEQILKLIQSRGKPSPRRLTPSFLINYAQKSLKGIQTPKLSFLGNVSRSFLTSSLF